MTGIFLNTMQRSFYDLVKYLWWFSLWYKALAYIGGVFGTLPNTFGVTLCKNSSAFNYFGKIFHHICLTWSYIIPVPQDDHAVQLLHLVVPFLYWYFIVLFVSLIVLTHCWVARVKRNILWDSLKLKTWS